MKVSRKWALVLVGALSLVALVLAGCIKIIYTNIPSGIPAGSNYTITMQAKLTLDLNNIAPTVAIRVPNAWEVKTVEPLGGDHHGMVTTPPLSPRTSLRRGRPSPWMPRTTVRSRGTSGGPGTPPWPTCSKDDVITATITIDTHGAAGTFALDFVTGITDPAGYENQAMNANGANWESGSAGTPPMGVKLDQTTTLTAAGPTFLDVPVGHPYFDAIEGMAADGIINGYDVPGGKEFRPNNDVGGGSSPR